MARVYIETTIPSYYHESRVDETIAAWKRATRDWWDHYADRFELVTSRFVIAELSSAPAQKARACLELMKDVEILPEPEALSATAQYYIEQKAMPDGAGGDAYHLAMAALHGIEYLLTWNCQHLANASKQRHLTVLNTRLGLLMPIVTTPLTLLLARENRK
jgi:hypothetical protein